MTEEIIIDGVNVAGCNFYVKHCIEDCYDERVDLYEYCQMFGSECTNEKDCHYKQLKRLEQKYNEVLKLAKQNADSNEYCIQELEKELEPFKDEYFNGLSNEQIAELAKKSIRLTTYNRKLEKENEKLKDKVERLDKMTGIFSARLAKKYEQTLEEIKRMVKGHKIADETRLQAIEGLINKVLESEGE